MGSLYWEFGVVTSAQEGGVEACFLQAVAAPPSVSLLL